MNLELYFEYNREAVHDMFDPESPYTPQAGTWGLQGPIELPHRPGSWVFFVTFGKKQGDYEFDEAISTEGELRWQSQPQQSLDDARVKSWIRHDETRNTIYLFLRSASRSDGALQPYTYLGRLKYLSHDAVREKPVHFNWQLMDWPIPVDVLKRMKLRLEEPKLTTVTGLRPQAGVPLLEKHAVPSPPLTQALDTQTFRKPVRRGYAERDARNRVLGLAGEEIVLEYERNRLIDFGRPDLAQKIVHVSKVEGDGARYDIRSYTPEGQVKFIEVKTTTGDELTEFYVTSAEVRFSNDNAETYFLYRLHNFDQTMKSAKFFCLPGSLQGAFDLTPIQFKAGLRPQKA
jgi:hypothetical protein